MQILVFQRFDLPTLNNVWVVQVIKSYGSYDSPAGCFYTSFETKEEAEEFARQTHEIDEYEQEEMAERSHPIG